jgi:hypothetical protein
VLLEKKRKNPAGARAAATTFFSAFTDVDGRFFDRKENDRLT